MRSTASHLFWMCSLMGPVVTGAAALDPALRERIDAFVERERVASGLPGVSLAIVSGGDPPHVRGFGDDGRGKPITGDTPFPIGSLTKSFTALLIRQMIDAGQVDADAPVRRYLPWFRVADSEVSSRITLRHLLNQTSSFSLPSLCWCSCWRWHGRRRAGGARGWACRWR